MSHAFSFGCGSFAAGRTFSFRGCLVAMVAILGACGGSAPLEHAPTRAPEQTSVPETPEVAPEASSEVPVPASTPTPPDPRASNPRGALGTELAALVESAAQVEVGHMSTFGALQAEQQTLRANTTLVGYPIVGALRALTRDQARALATLLLDDASYGTELSRCANTRWVGARFTSGPNVVEFGLGMPCKQAFWASSPDGTTIRWGSNMTPAAANAAEAIVNAP